MWLIWKKKKKVNRHKRLWFIIKTFRSSLIILRNLIEKRDFLGGPSGNLRNINIQWLCLWIFFFINNSHNKYFLMNYQNAEETAKALIKIKKEKKKKKN